MNTRMHAAAWQSIAEERQREIDRLRTIIKDAVEAYDSGNLQMSSPEIGEPENDIPIHPWHEEWLHHARTAIDYRTPTEEENRAWYETLTSLER